MRNSTKAAALGAGLGMVALALVTPGLVSGNARTAVGTGAAAATTAAPFVASLIGGAEEVPNPGDPDGSGAASVTIDRTTGEVCWDIRTANIAPATLAHIHRGVRGASGPVVVDLMPPLPNPTSAGCIMATPAIATEIATTPSGFYVNIHNAEHPGGAIRGQLAGSGSSSGGVRLLDAPVRVYDSRGVGPTGSILMAGETRTIGLGTSNAAPSAGAPPVIAVPPGATAALVRIAATNTTGPGFLKAYSAALTTEPPTAVLNLDKADAIIGGETHVAVNPLAQIKITGGVSNTHVVVDVVGYIY